MLETIITSSVLIAVLILLRYLFKGKINVQLQYALWLLVAIRLLLPFSIVSSSLSVLNIVDISGTREQIESPAVLPPSVSAGLTGDTISEASVGPVGNSGISPDPGQGSQADSAITQNEKASVGDILYSIWLVGAVAAGLWFVLQNMWFYRRLRKTRQAAEMQSSRPPVYLTRCVKSPCLFGLLHPAVYIHPDSLKDSESLRYILAHEETHYRHGDHLWSYLRCVCLAMYWFNPFVWWAAVLSRRDCEIACDESTLNRIGDAHRIAYGNTLINMITHRSTPSELLCGATTMTSGISGIKERITMIAKKPKMLASTLIAVILIMATIVGCTFTGANEPKNGPLTDNELSYFNGDEFFNGEYLNIRNQFLSSIYESPEQIDLFQLFYSGSGTAEIPTEAEKAAVVAQNGWDAEPDTACEKISRANMEAVLTKYTGLTLLDTAKVGLENFTYLAEYDAYYYYHGDTNYRAKITFSRGEREGDILRLFYDDVYFGDGKKILTLREKDGGYLFVSNVYDGKPIESSPDADVSLYERAGVTIAMPNEYLDQLLIDPVEHDDDRTLISVYQKSTFEKYEGMGLLFSIVRYTEAQYEQFLSSDRSGQGFFAKDGTYYYGFFFATDVQAPDDFEAYRALFSAVGDFVKSDVISRNGLTPYSDNEFFTRTYTYDSAHVYYKYYPYYAVNGSKEEVWTLFLSQPATQGAAGIWCVERWRDQSGNIYPYFPNEDGKPAREYYEALQLEADAGRQAALLDPEQAAISFVKKAFGHNVTLSSFDRAENSGIPAELFAMSTGNIKDYMPKLIAGESVSAYDLLPCLARFTKNTWLELNTAYGSDWLDPLLAALRGAAISDMRADSSDQTMRNYYLGKAYLVADGAYSELLSDIVLRQWTDNSALYSAGISGTFSADEAARLRQLLLYLVSHRGGDFHLSLPGADPELTLSLNAYPADFPFGANLTEKSRETYKAESFGQVTVIESDGLQVKYLNNYEGVYGVFSIRAVEAGLSSNGVAIGDPEEKLWDHWIPTQLRKLDSISYDDEAWFGSDYDYAYVHTPQDSIKSVVYLVKDGLIWGIELINGLDGPMYP